MPPTLSVCILAKNAAAEIGRAIESVAGLPFETEVLVADDAASTDDTAGVAERFGARVSKITWRDDFAAARNALLDQARGEWLFWLDADEQLDPRSRGELVRCLQQPDALAFSVLRQDLIDAGQPELFTITTVQKLVRRRPDVRYAGRVHERPDPPLVELAGRLGMRVGESTVAVRHWGYVGPRRADKHRRNARLLELELRDRPGQLYQLIEYGRTLLLLGDARGHTVLGEAARAVALHRDGAAAPSPIVALLLEYLLQSPPGAPVAAAADAEALALRWFPSSPPLLWWIARRRFAADDLAGAADVLEKLIGLGASGAYDRTTSFDPHILGDDARLNLAACHLRTGRLDEAERLLRPLASSPRVGKQAMTNLEMIVGLRRRFHAGDDGAPPSA